MLNQNKNKNTKNSSSLTLKAGEGGGRSRTGVTATRLCGWRCPVDVVVVAADDAADADVGADGDEEDDGETAVAEAERLERLGARRCKSAKLSPLPLLLLWKTGAETAAIRALLLLLLLLLFV